MSASVARGSLRPPACRASRPALRDDRLRKCAGVRRPERQRIEPGTEHDKLAGAMLNRNRQRILGDARARCDEPSQPRTGRVIPGMSKRGLVVGPENARREGIGKDRSLVQYLVRRAQAGGAQRGQTWSARLHGRVLGAPRPAVHATKKSRPLTAAGRLTFRFLVFRSGSLRRRVSGRSGSRSRRR
jgi:hypothetical protein